MKQKSSISGIGIDIEEVDRFRKLSFNENENFYKKIFAQDEINYCLKKADPYPHFTARFCAKEAVMKAFPQKITNPQDIKIIMRNDKPEVKINTFDLGNIFLSMSHTKDYAIAIVIIEII